MPIPVESPSITLVRDKLVTSTSTGGTLPAEMLVGGTEVRDKVVTAVEAVRLIRDGDAAMVTPLWWKDSLASVSPRN